MFFRQTDIPFATDETHKFLPWLIGVMTGLAALLLCLGLSLNNWVVDRNDTYSGNFTVNIPASEQQADHVTSAKAALKKMPNIQQVSQLSDDKLKEMLKPWLGDGAFDDLPMPVVLEVSLVDPAKKIDHAALEKTLSELVPSVEIDTHDRWVSAFSQFSVTLRTLLGVLSLLIVVVMGMAIAYTSRASLRLHARTVHMLHAIGAEDDYIMRQFQQEALRVALPGAIVGCMAAGILYWASGAYLVSLNISLLPPLAITLPHVLLLFALPVACAFAAWVLARLSIVMLLQRVL
jgi:cell division transport system permease protein